jgi:hypothetical protein
MYRIIRFYKNAGISRRIIKTHLSLDQARKHCKDPQTSSSTCTNPVGIRRTREIGSWFDGYASM